MNMLRGLFVFNFFAFAMAGLAPCIQLNDGYNIPILALGTGRGTIKESETIDQVRQAVFWAIEAGYRHIDTASIYGDEEQVGQGIAEAIKKGLVTREDLFVTSKLWNDKHARQDVVPALKESLRLMGLDYLDLFLIHFPFSEKSDGSADNIDYLETWEGMQEARYLGLTRSIGVSNFNITQISRLVENSGVWPAVHQFEVNPTLTQEPLVAHCQKLGITVMAYSPFGFVVSRNNGLAPPPNKDDPTLVAMAKKYGKTVEQIVLRYLVDRGLIPIPKSTNQGRITQNIDIFDFQLNDYEVAIMNRFNKNVRVVHPTNYKDYPNYPFERI